MNGKFKYGMGTINKINENITSQDNTCKLQHHQETKTLKTDDYTKKHNTMQYTICQSNNPSKVSESKQ